jgi:hypothetical protein
MLGSGKGILFAVFLRWLLRLVALMLLLGVSACTVAEPRSADTPTMPRSPATGMAAAPHSSGTVMPPPGGKISAVVPRPDHVVVVILENEKRSSVIGSARAPYLNELAARGANLTHSYGVTHPSQPNYLGCSPSCATSLARTDSVLQAAAVSDDCSTRSKKAPPTSKEK